MPATRPERSRLIGAAAPRFKRLDPQAPGMQCRVQRRINRHVGLQARIVEKDRPADTRRIEARVDEFLLASA